MVGVWESRTYDVDGFGVVGGECFCYLVSVSFSSR